VSDIDYFEMARFMQRIERALELEPVSWAMLKVVRDTREREVRKKTRILEKLESGASRIKGYAIENKGNLSDREINMLRSLYDQYSRAAKDVKEMIVFLSGSADSGKATGRKT